ncbi:17801_t:CDS:2 [Cetraspora pellucida]|uniref:17801_t:CDS:1 n=1 Tax=Cetraspora pellucida TaxID=1433469 RepID=A0A9N9IWD7_9GLOM|nr:17801_t:CDS:2 [Cetraspora pellucida]
MLKQVEDSMDAQDLKMNILQDNSINSKEIEKYLNNLDKDIVYKIPDNDQIILDFVETFRERSGEIENNFKEVDDSVEEKIISLNAALKSIENICTFLF